MNLSDTNLKVFTEQYAVNDWEIKSPEGWSEIKQIMKTIPYQGFHLECEDGLNIECAEDHILILHNDNEIFVKDCIEGTLLKSINGVSKVLKCFKIDRLEECYDLEINNETHTFYVNGLVSHNCVAGDTLVRVRKDNVNQDMTIKDIHNDIYKEIKCHL